MTPEEWAVKICQEWDPNWSPSKQPLAFAKLMPIIAEAIREAIEADRVARQCPDADVVAIRERCEKATPGPWTFDSFAHVIRAEFAHPRKVLFVSGTYLGGEASEDDYIFIAHARQDIPALLALVDDQAALIHDLSQDGRSADAYQRGLEIGRREERERAVAPIRVREEPCWPEADE